MKYDSGGKRYSAFFLWVLEGLNNLTILYSYIISNQYDLRHLNI